MASCRLYEILSAGAFYLREDGGPASINALIGGPANRREAFNEYLGLDSSDMTDEEVARRLPRFREVLAERLFAFRSPSERRRNEEEAAA